MNFMAYGIPVVAAVEPRSEVARIVESSGGGWVSNSARPAEFPQRIVEALDDHPALERRGAAGAAYAHANFSPEGVAERFEEVLADVIEARGSRNRSRSVLKI